MYFPDHYAKQRSPERDYFWGTIFGVKPGYGKALIMHAIEQRNQTAQDSAQDNS